jgi:hypothetical protein
MTLRQERSVIFRAVREAVKNYGVYPADRRIIARKAAEICIIH